MSVHSYIVQSQLYFVVNLNRVFWGVPNEEWTFWWVVQTVFIGSEHHNNKKIVKLSLVSFSLRIHSIRNGLLSSFTFPHLPCPSQLYFIRGILWQSVSYHQLSRNSVCIAWCTYFTQKLLHIILSLNVRTYLLSCPLR